MLLNQTYNLTPQIQSLLNTIEGQRTAFSLIAVKPELVLHFRRHSLLGSARFSASIEGIIPNPKKQDQLAIQNLVKTYTWLYTLPSKQPLDLEFIKTIHAKSLQHLSTDAGHLRTEQSAIFNSGGVAIYLTPPPQEIPTLLTHWFLQRTDLCKVIMSHYQFEKIHPFLDGNGRVGRLILASELRNLGYDFGGLLVLEEGIDQARDEYYFHLQKENKDITGFIEYILTLITNSASKVLEKISRPRDIVTLHLLPRRQELLAIIFDHSPCSFDFLHRRFIAIPPSTLRFDLLSLQKSGHIKKLGTTRGALYSASPTE